MTSTSASTSPSCMSYFPRIMAFGAVLILSSAYVILLDQSKNRTTRHFEYSFILLLLLTSICKLIFTISMWLISLYCTKEHVYLSLPPRLSLSLVQTRRILVEQIEMNGMTSNSLSSPSHARLSTSPTTIIPGSNASSLPPSPHDGARVDKTLERQTLLTNRRESNSIANHADEQFGTTPSNPPQRHNYIRDFIRFSLSAGIYLVNDVFVFVVMNQGFSARNYTVVVTGKISIVCLLSRIILKRKSTMIQYTAVILLSIGIVVSAWPFAPDPTETRPTLGGYGIVLLAEIIGAIAGVYNEWLMKDTPNPQHMSARQQRHHMYYQNVHMYSATVFILIPTLLIWDRERIFGSGSNIFSDWSPLLSIILIINACRGLSIAAVYTYSTILSKIFIIACSLLLTAVVTHFALDSPLDMQFVLALGIILCALYLYAAPPQHLIAGAVMEKPELALSPAPSQPPSQVHRLEISPQDDHDITSGTELLSGPS